MNHEENRSYRVRRHVGRIVFQLTLSFLLLALAVGGVTVFYWFFLLQPRLLLAAETNAKLLAQAQAVSLAEVLQPRGDPVSVSEVEAAMDKILLATDPATDQPLIVGLALELDYNVVLAADKTLNLQRGKMGHPGCFCVPVPLYAPLTDELLGIARFHISPLFFQTLEQDIRQTLIAEFVLILILLLVVWRWVLSLGRRLRREVFERQRAEQEAQEANQAKSQFLANMSHEIRTPINAIQGLLYLAQQNKLSPKLRNHLNKMEHSAHTLLTIINDILDFSKIEAGHIDLDNIPFDLQAVLDRIRSIVGFRALERGLALTFHQDERTPKYLRGDPHRLGQILLNLVGNAIKFTEQGEVVISIQVIENFPEQIRLEFSIRDTGIGMTPEQQGRLFQMFNQADASITRRFGGTGLGLVISQRLVEMMGGRIVVASVPDQGSTFRFTAAFGHAAPEEVETRQESSHVLKEMQRLRGARVLLVEDQPLNQEVAAEILRQAGLQVQIADQGQEALAALQANPSGFDVVLMDLQMPVLDGYAATRQLRADPRFAGLPIIAMTANVLAGERERCLAAGMNDYLAKPIDVSNLYQKLRLWVKNIAVEPPAVDANARTEAPSPINKTTASTLPNAAPGLDLAAGLQRVGGNEALYRRLLARFPDQHGAVLAEIQAALDAGDKEQAAHQAHALAGVAGNLAATSLEQAMRQLERAIIEGANGIRLHFRYAEARWQEVLTGIDQLNSRTETTGEIGASHDARANQPPLSDREPWAAQIAVLAELLTARDLKAKSYFAELMRQITDPQIHQQLQPVGQQIERLHFADALQILNQVMTSSGSNVVD
ncbi:MAG: response regulator [Gammaproteobacteria bacterium]|nr:response regulator [Gammaproteobacteria bacterium]HRX71336.1 ATP-binding protein [Candidatus Competibacteraceae bacterium]